MDPTKSIMPKKKKKKIAPLDKRSKCLADFTAHNSATAKVQHKKIIFKLQPNYDLVINETKIINTGLESKQLY